MLYILYISSSSIWINSWFKFWIIGSWANKWSKSSFNFGPLHETWLIVAGPIIVARTLSSLRNRLWRPEFPPSPSRRQPGHAIFHSHFERINEKIPWSKFIQIHPKKYSWLNLFELVTSLEKIGRATFEWWQVTGFSRTRRSICTPCLRSQRGKKVRNRRAAKNGGPPKKTNQTVKLSCSPKARKTVLMSNEMDGVVSGLRWPCEGWFW